MPPRKEKKTWQKWVWQRFGFQTRKCSILAYMKCCCCQTQALCEFYQVRIRGLFKFLQEQFNMSFLFCIVFLIMVLLVMSTFMKLNQFHYDGFFLFYNLTPVGNDLFKVKNRNSRTRCEICSNLTLNMFHPLF